MALRNGARFSVGMADVFPDGCYLVPGSISEAQDYDEKTKTRHPAKDKVTGTRVFQCRVVDMNPELEGRSRETVVKILTDYQPVPPGRSVRAGGVRGPDGHPVRQRQGPDGVLAARHRRQGRGPPGPRSGSVQGRGVTAARRVPALAVPVDSRAAVTFLGYANRSPLLAITTGRALLVTLTLPDRLEAGHVEFARQLACRSMAYAVEVERRYRGLAPLPAGEQVTA
jgi:hypothetical protein